MEQRKEIFYELKNIYKRIAPLIGERIKGLISLRIVPDLSSKVKLCKQKNYIIHPPLGEIT